MKINRHFTIDVDLAKKLQQEDNASALVERLLKQHFQNFRKGSNPLQSKTLMLTQLSKNARKMRKEIKIIHTVMELADEKAIRWLMGNSENGNELFYQDYQKYLRDRNLLGVKSAEKLKKAQEIVSKNLDLFTREFN